MRHTKDPYKLLGVAKDANADAIKTAFREKAKQYHPDTTTDEKKKKELEEQFKQINAAYDILSDPEKRAAFDNPTSNFNGMDLNDIINSFMGGHMRGGFPGAMPGGFHFSFNGPGNASFHQTLQQSIDIDVFTLMLGGEIAIGLPDGKEKKINVPPNTPANARFKLALDKNTTIILIPNIVIPYLSDEKLKKLKEIINI